MGFFKSLKGDHPDTVGNSTVQPSGTHSSSAQEYDPPPEPPPSHRPMATELYSAPSEPPPNRNEYLPPPGPPPSQRQPDVDPPPYHDWTVIEDTALLPPPPSIGHESSPSGNASLLEAERAHEWCRVHPLVKPHYPTPPQYNSVKYGDIRLIKPLEYHGDLLMPSTGAWSGSTVAGSKDSCLLSSFPLYFALSDSPLKTQMKKKIYFEIKIRSYGRGRGTDESSLALGYCAMPYPSWRMPGWERGSLAVHSDDGRRYVNDSWGGKDFTSAVRAGETVGLGLEFSVPGSRPDALSTSLSRADLNVDVFFTRNGRMDGGWNLHEQLDANEDLGIDGLDGSYDLYAAIGVFGGIEFDIFLNSRDWLWQPK